MRNNLKIGLYLETYECQNEDYFDNIMRLVQQSEIEILVFPECSWNFDDISILNDEDKKSMREWALGLSKKFGCVLILGAIDKNDIIFNIYANAFATDGETDTHFYIKHTMTDFSAFELNNYHNLKKQIFEPIIYQGYKIGMTICYDCNHSMFSRIYGLQNIDILINSTGGDVIFDKWQKYNKARAIENHCYNFVTMGGDGTTDKPKCYVYGFNREGGELPFTALEKSVTAQNVPGTVYIYDLSKDNKQGTPDRSLYQKENESKYQHIHIPTANLSSLLKKAQKIKDSLYIYNIDKINLVIVIADNENILKPEKHLPLIYADELKNYDNKRYLILCRYDNLDEKFYQNKLSTILKVRSMENYCAVILESKTHNKCYQTSKNRAAQVVKAENGYYGLDLDRMKGPETIWTNKQGMKASWRNNLEWLIKNMTK